MQLARQVLDEAAQAVAVGVTCDDIDRIVHEVRTIDVDFSYLITPIQQQSSKCHTSMNA